MKKLLSVVLAFSIAFTPSLSSARGSKKKAMAVVGVLAAGTAIYLATRNKEVPVKVEVTVEHVLKAYDAAMDTHQDAIDFREKLTAFREAYVGLSAVAYSAYLVKVCSQDSLASCEDGFRMAYLAAKHFDEDKVFTNAVCQTNASMIANRWNAMHFNVSMNIDAQNDAASQIVLRRAEAEAEKFSKMAISPRCKL
jgi:hypothetical protein